MAVSSHTHLIFVYGTLLRGQNNYSYWLADPAEATFVSTATTADRYPLFVNLLPDHPGCSPCVLNKPNYGSEDRCFHVSGELFLVSDRMLAWLNVLEGIADGVYTASPIAVVMGQLPHSLEVKGQDHLHTLLAPFHLNTNNNSNNSSNNNNSLYIPNQTTLKALIYFRSKSFPADWDAPSPRSCSTLLRSFSQEAMLNAYGKRFNGLPAHMQSADAAREMHAELQALPIAHRPQLESCTLGAPIAPKPIVLFIIDGVGDNTYTELGNRTPLEAVAGCPPRQCAAEPTLGLPAAAAHAFAKGDATTATSDDTDIPSEWASAHSSAVSLGINTVTAAGVSGLMDPYMAGQSCGSDTAHLSMFGYPPTTYYRGRGAYEALGAGLVLEDEDIAFKSNFATFADPTENGFGDEDPEQEALAPADGQGQYVTHRRCDREFRSEGPVLSAALHGTRVAEDLEGKPFDYAHAIHVRYATEHRCGVALTGAQTLPDGCVVGMLSDKITGTDCLKDGRYLRRCEPTVDASHDEYQSAVYTCRLVEAASARITDILRQHPINEARRAHNRRVGAEGGSGGGERKNVANLVLFRGAAKKGWVPTFAVRHGLSGLMVAPTCIIKGLGLCCGLQDAVCRACYPDAESQREALKAATGDVHSDLSVKVDAVLHALRLSSNHPHCTHGGDCSSSVSNYQQHYGFIVLHVKGVDDAGHDGSLHEKMDMLQKCGAAMARLWEALPAGATMAVVADHSTPLAVGDHCCEPVPVSIAVKQGGGKASPLGDGVRRYGEVDAAGGALRRFRGEALIPTMKRMHAHYHYE